MKKTITLISLIVLTLSARSQSFTDDLETFTLSTNSAYTSTTSAPFEGTTASFEYKWDTGFNFWSGGFSYTNKYDSSTAGFGNLYGVKPYKGYNNSNTYAIGQDKGIIKLKTPYKGVEGMYLTNATYPYKSMKNGDAFAKKFGGVSGNDPDFFKITIKGFFGGVLKTDSVEFYLADFRNSNNALDYIVNSWQWVNTSSLGEIDSLKFFMYSSDVGSFGINTPLFFGLDNFTASPSFVGLTSNSLENSLSVFPNPCSNFVYVNNADKKEFSIQLMNSNGMILKEEKNNDAKLRIDLSEQTPGIYFLKLSNENESLVKKLIKN